MKKYLLLTLSAMCMLGCSSKNNSQSSSSTQKNSSSVTSTSSSFLSSSLITSTSSTISSSSSSEVTKEDSSISLKMFGELNYGATRTIYASSELSKDIVWTSSNPEVVSVSPREGLSSECFLSGLSHGKSVIRAALASNPKDYTEMEIEVKEGVEMDEQLFKSLTSSMKVTSVDKCLSYDKDYNVNVDEEYLITTIYEERDVTNLSEDNHTDGYHINVVDSKTNVETYNKTYVRGNANYLATEYINIYNNIAYETIVDDENQGTKFDHTYYINHLNNVNITNESFRSYDGGKTYHFVGFYMDAIYVATSLTLLDISPDDMYFEIDGEDISLVMEIDPYNSETTSNVKYGRKIVSSITERLEAKIPHVATYERMSYHDELESAINEVKESKNYKVEYTLDYASTADTTFKFIFTEDTIDQEVYVGSQLISHTGAHKNSDTTYYEYEVKDNQVSITKEHNQAWDAVNRYPTFDFSVNIFELVKTNTYKTLGNHGLFIAHCFYLPNNLSIYSFDEPGFITLENGKLKTISTTIDELGDDLGFKATFSCINEASTNLDFENTTSPEAPKTFEEENPALASVMSKWNMPSDLPYLNPENGFKDYIGYIRDENAANGIKYAYLTTDYFSNSELRDKYKSDYEALLEAAGYVFNNTYDEFNNKIFSKNGYEVSVGPEYRYWNDSYADNIRINVKSSKLVNGN